MPVNTEWQSSRDTAPSLVIGLPVLCDDERGASDGRVEYRRKHRFDRITRAELCISVAEHHSHDADIGLAARASLISVYQSVEPPYQTDWEGFV